MFGSRKPPYSDIEVSNQIGHISRLIEQEKQHPSKLALEAIETAREVLAFMLDEIRAYQNRLGKQ